MIATTLPMPPNTSSTNSEPAADPARPAPKTDPIISTYTHDVEDRSHLGFIRFSVRVDTHPQHQIRCPVHTEQVLEEHYWLQREQTDDNGSVQTYRLENISCRFCFWRSAGPFYTLPSVHDGIERFLRDGLHQCGRCQAQQQLIAPIWIGPVDGCRSLEDASKFLCFPCAKKKITISKKAVWACVIFDIKFCDSFLKGPKKVQRPPRTI